jgi:hypothetical protein
MWLLIPDCYKAISGRNPGAEIAEIADIDGHRQAQPLRECLSIVLTLCKLLILGH